METSRFDSPVVVMISPTEDQGRQSIVTYDHHTEDYHLFDCTEEDCAAELRLYDGKMICMQHFPLRKPSLSVPEIKEIIQLMC